MNKVQTLRDPNSCLNKAADDEMLFTLREKDPAMADTIRYWVQRRIELGLNKQGDLKLDGALAMAQILENRRNY